MSGKRSRTKGHAFEREVARALTEVLDHPFERNLEETRGTGGLHGVDVVSKDRVHPILVQCKVGKRPPFYQAVADMDAAVEGTGDWAVAVVRQNRVAGKPARDFAIMDFETLLDILRKLRAHGGLL